MSVYFHLPPHIDWNAEFILRELLRRKIDAALVGKEIHVTLASEACEVWRKQHQSQLDRRSAEGLPSRPHMAIRHYANRFLRNVELDRHVFGAPRSEQHVILAQAAILDLGTTLLDSLDTEFGIVTSQFKQAAEIASFRQRIEHQIAEKEKHIATFDFELAAAARDGELKVRDELEAFLLFGQE